MRACRERLSEIDHDFSKASALGNFALAWLFAEDPEATRSSAEEALAVTEGRGFHTQEALARIVRGWARACQGEADEGVRDVESGFALAETSGSDVLSSALYVAAADTYRMAGDRERAKELLGQATRICERDGLVGATALVTAAEARLHLELGGEPAEAETLFLQALGEADSFGLLWFGLITATRLARLAPHTGKAREAHDRLAARYASLREGFDRAPAREAKAALEELAALLDGETRGPSA
jgi:tetratricopeptide (TPR) repeat protein